MTFKIYPLKGVNQIEFDMHVQDVRRLIGREFSTGDIRAKSKEFPTDYNLQERFFFYYDENGMLEAVEFASGADIILDNVNPLSLNWGQAKALMSKLDPESVFDDEGAESQNFGLAIWCPDADEGDGASLESFLVARPGYIE